MSKIPTNRLHPQKSRMEIEDNIAYLEKKQKHLQDKISLVQTLVEANRNLAKSLKIENNLLELIKLDVDKSVTLRYAEYAKVKASLNRMKEMKNKRIAEIEAIMHNKGAASNSNLNPSQVGPMVCLNPNEAQDGGEETSRLTNDTSKLTTTKSEPDVDG